MKNPWMISTGRHVLTLLSLSALLIAFGTLGYMITQGFRPIDALFMTVITLTTVGYGEVRPLDDTGRLFTIVLIMMGAGFVAYNLAYFTQLLLDGDLLELYRRRRVRKKLEQLNGHYIVCGYGQMGQVVARELLKHDIPLVVIENDENAIIRLQEKAILHLAGDATEEENLSAVGVDRAKGLVSVVARDTDNVFIVLTARDLNKDLFICVRASTPGTEKRLLKAGADRVVSPYASSALRIAHQILRPTVTDFMELALSGEGMELSMEELQVPAGADLVGKELMNSGIRSDYDLIIVAIKRKDGEMIYNPSPKEMLQAGDTLVAIGPQANLKRFGSRLYGSDCPSLKACVS